jgi:hypothetical protein
LCDRGNVNECTTTVLLSRINSVPTQHVKVFQAATPVHAMLVILATVSTALTLIDECATKTDDCSPSAIACVRNEGSHSCGGSCPTGFVGNGCTCNPNGTIQANPDSQVLISGVNNNATVHITSFVSASSSVFFNLSGISTSRYKLLTPSPLLFTITNPTQSIVITLLFDGQTKHPQQSLLVLLTSSTSVASIGNSNSSTIIVEVVAQADGVVTFLPSYPIIQIVPVAATVIDFTLVRITYNISSPLQQLSAQIRFNTSACSIVGGNTVSFVNYTNSSTFSVSIQKDSTVPHLLAL